MRLYFPFCKHFTPNKNHNIKNLYDHVLLSCTVLIISIMNSKRYYNYLLLLSFLLVPFSKYTSFEKLVTRHEFSLGAKFTLFV